MEILSTAIIAFVVILLQNFVRLKWQERKDKQMYSVFVNGEFKEEINYGSRDSYFNRVNYKSTIRMTVDPKTKKINILVDYV